MKRLLHIQRYRSVVLVALAVLWAAFMMMGAPAVMAAKGGVPSKPKDTSGTTPIDTSGGGGETGTTPTGDNSDTTPTDTNGGGDSGTTPTDTSGGGSDTTSGDTSGDTSGGTTTTGDTSSGGDSGTTPTDTSGGGDSGTTPTDTSSGDTSGTGTSTPGDTNDDGICDEYCDEYEYIAQMQAAAADPELKTYCDQLLYPDYARDTGVSIMDQFCLDLIQFREY